jgi:hypothetical protein
MTTPGGAARLARRREEGAGGPRQKFGDEFPQWRRDMKSGPLARARARLGQLTAAGS